MTRADRAMLRRTADIVVERNPALRGRSKTAKTRVARLMVKHYDATMGGIRPTPCSMEHLAYR